MRKSPASCEAIQSDPDGSGSVEMLERNSSRSEPIFAKESRPRCNDDVAADAKLSPVPAADPTTSKGSKPPSEFLGRLRHREYVIASISPRVSPNSPTRRRRVRQSGQNQEARSSALRRRRGAARQAGAHGNRVARPILQTASPLQRLVGELVDEDLFFRQVKSETVDVHDIDLFGSPAGAGIQQAEVLFV